MLVLVLGLCYTFFFTTNYNKKSDTVISPHFNLLLVAMFNVFISHLEYIALVYHVAYFSSITPIPATNPTPTPCHDIRNATSIYIILQQISHTVLSTSHISLNR